MSLINNRIRGWREIEAFASTIVCIGLFIIWILTHQAFRGDFPSKTYAVYGILIACASLGYNVSVQRKNQDATENVSTLDDFGSAFAQTVTVAFVLFAYLVAAQDAAISRLFLFTYLPALCAALLLFRKTGLRYLGPLIFKNRHHCRALLVGDVAMTARAAAWLSSKADFGLDPVGRLGSHDNIPNESSQLPWLGDVRQLKQALASTGAGVVFVTDFIKSSADVSWLRSICDQSGARLIFNINLDDTAHTGFPSEQSNKISLITFRDEPLESPFNRMLKRTLDVTISLPVVIFILPVLALAVRLIHIIQSPGPLMFNQERGGRYGTPFTIYKFRTMHVANDDETRQASKGDVRIFPLGGLLRKLSLDEFPQFLNVLQGKMSIVGPRPHMTAHDNHFAQLASSYKVRTFIKPGITGLAQVSGFRGPTPTSEDVVGRTMSDLYYLENWSLKMDLIIIFRTAFQFLKQKEGAL